MLSFVFYVLKTRVTCLEIIFKEVNRTYDRKRMWTTSTKWGSNALFEHSNEYLFNFPRPLVDNAMWSFGVYSLYNALIATVFFDEQNDT